MHLYKQDGGNLKCVDSQDVNYHRAQGYKPLDELYPTLPTAADLDAVAAEDNAREATKTRRGRK